MKLRKRELQNIAREVLNRLERSKVNIQNLPYESFNNFPKTRVPAEIVRQVVRKWNLDQEQLQIEIAQIVTDLTREVHRHDLAHAYVVRIDGRFGIPSGGRGFAYLENGWLPFEPGDEIDIPRGVPHGFAVKPGEVPIFFLSVQSPPIVDDHGCEDYTRVQPLDPAPVADDALQDELAEAG